MGGIISVWRALPLVAMYTILPIAAIAIIKLPEFSAIARAANHTLSTISNPDIRSQMQTPVIMVNFLPIGVKGLLATVMLFFSFTCHDTYMHSWGSIFVQDVVMPLRKRPLDPVRHVTWLRWSIIGVAIFAFFFSLLYNPREDILMFFAITGTIWLGGSGAVIVGGLYWRKGTTLAAYSSLLLGAVVGVGGIIVSHWYLTRYGHEFPLNDQWLFAITMLGASLIYVTVSLMTHSQWKRRVLMTAAITAILYPVVFFGVREVIPALYQFVMQQVPIIKWTMVGVSIAMLYTAVCIATCREVEKDFNLERMLHRGQYADAVAKELEKSSQISVWQKVVGITGEFSFGDKCVAVSVIVWNMGWAASFVVVSILHYAFHVQFASDWWAHFWHVYLLATFFLGVPITVWITVGGVMDIKALFKTLSTAVRDHTDDGRVIHDHDKESLPMTEAASGIILETLVDDAQ
jgi:SSS family solute:Na+ symporter